MAARRAGSALGLLAPLLFLAFTFFDPLRRVLLTVSSDALRWLQIPFVQDRIASAFQQAVLSTALAIALAAPLVYIHQRRIVGERWLLALHAAAFVMPVFVVVYGLRATVFPLIPSLSPLGAVVMANAYYNYGFATRLALSHLHRRPRALEEAARTLGASPTGSFLRVSLPILAGPLASVALLVFLWCMGSFGVVYLLGQGEVSTFETLLYDNLGGLFPRLDRAAALGTLQLIMNASLLAAVFMARRRGRFLSSGQPRRSAGLAGTALAWTLAGAATLPILAVLVGGFRHQGNWSLEPWRALIDVHHPFPLGVFDLGHALGLSILYAASSAALGLILCACLAYSARPFPSLKRFAELLASIPLGTSSLLLGFGLLLAFGAEATFDLRATKTLIILAHTILVFPFMARFLLPAFETLDTRYEEAARSLGAGAGGVALRVHLPLLRSPLLAALGFAVALSLADFGASFLLMRPENMGLAVWIEAHDVPFQGLMRAQSVALTGLLAVFAGLAYAITQRFEVKA